MELRKRGPATAPRPRHRPRVTPPRVDWVVENFGLRSRRASGAVGARSASEDVALDDYTDVLLCAASNMDIEFSLRLIGVVACGAVAVGCSQGDADHRLDIVFDPCSGVVISAPGATEDELASIDAALASWGDVAAVRLSRTPQPGWAEITIHFEEAAEAMRGVYDDERGVVYVNRRLTKPHARSITVAHELGHAFGLWHVEGRASVMNPGNLKYAPNAEDARSIGDLWPACRAEQP